MSACTGRMASWCPIHGDCTCPHSDDGEIAWHYEPGIVSFHGFPAYSATAQVVTHYDEECPIHSMHSDHPRTSA